MRRFRRLRVIVAAATFLLLATTCRQVDAAPELLGEWSTDAPQYRDRGFRITSDSLLLGVGAGLVDANRLRSISRAQERDRVRFDITYTNVARRSLDVRLYYYPETQVVRWASRSDVIWRRVSP